MLRTLPNLTICQPKDEDDLAALLIEALERRGPTIIRYPRGPVPAKVEAAAPFARARLSVWATGDWYPKACEIARRLGGEAVHARYLKPFDAEALAAARRDGKLVVSLENAALAGGFGEAIGADLKFGWPDEFIAHGTVGELERRYGLDVDSMTRKIRKAMENYG
jgi:1-deoxy-D-xylulose-5-phosphate synthase